MPLNDKLNAELLKKMIEAGWDRNAFDAARTFTSFDPGELEPEHQTTFAYKRGKSLYIDGWDEVPIDENRQYRHKRHGWRKGSFYTVDEKQEPYDHGPGFSYVHVRDAEEYLKTGIKRDHAIRDEAYKGVVLEGTVLRRTV